MVNIRECEAADLDPKEVERLARRLERAGREAQRLGLEIFGGSGSASLRTTDDLIVANVGGPAVWDGGAGDEQVGPDGLSRGERGPGLNSIGSS